MRDWNVTGFQHQSRLQEGSCISKAQQSWPRLAAAGVTERFCNDPHTRAGDTEKVLKEEKMDLIRTLASSLATLALCVL